MALTRTRQQIREEARSLADLPEADSLVLDTTINTWIDRYHKDLYEILWGTEGRYYFLKQDTLTGAGPTLTLPSDFLDLEGIYFTDVNTGVVEQLPPDYFPMAEELTGTLTYRIRYIPTPTLFSSDSATIDTVAGWDDYIVYNIAADLLAVEENDGTRWLAKAAEAESRIRALVGKRRAAPTLRAGWKRNTSLNNTRWGLSASNEYNVYYELLNGGTIKFYRVREY